MQCQGGGTGVANATTRRAGVTLHSREALIRRLKWSLRRAGSQSEPTPGSHAKALRASARLSAPGPGVRPFGPRRNLIG